MGIVLVLLVAFVVLWPTLRAYVTQQEQLRDLNAQLADTNAQVVALEKELERWSDPDFVRAQARERFSYVAPGETAYRVIDPETVTGEDPMAELTAQANERSPYAPSQTQPWYVSVWGSVEVSAAAAEALAAEGGETAETGDGADDAPAGTTDPAVTDPAVTDPAVTDPAVADPGAE